MLPFQNLAYDTAHALDIGVLVLSFALLNLAFSTQAAYAAPLILLAQTRQADRDKTQFLIITLRRAMHTISSRF